MNLSLRCVGGIEDGDKALLDTGKRATEDEQIKFLIALQSVSVSQPVGEREEKTYVETQLTGGGI